MSSVACLNLRNSSVPSSETKEREELEYAITELTCCVCSSSITVLYTIRSSILFHIPEPEDAQLKYINRRASSNDS